MPRRSTSITVVSNNQELLGLFQKIGEYSDVRFEKGPHLSSSYCLYLADLSADITDLSQQLLELLQECLTQKAKLVICLLFADKIDIEKVHYLNKLLSTPEGSDPIYRLCFVRDLYQDILPHPVTYLDKLLWRSVSETRWNTSTKGKNLLYPVHIYDLLDLIIKSLFLNNTAGRSFWVFGDKYTDLEIGFLLKNLLDDQKNKFEIDSNLENFQDDPQYYSLGNDTQIALGWRPDIDFSQKIKTISESYRSILLESGSDPVPGEVSSVSRNLSAIKHRLLRFNLKRHSLKISNRFLAYSIKALAIVVLLYLVTAGVFAWALTKEYFILNRSLELITKGDLERSVEETKSLLYYNRLGEFTYEPLRPFVSLISPRTGDQLVNLFAFNNYLSLSLENLQQTYVLADKIYHGLRDDQLNIDPAESILALQSNLALLYENLVQIRVSLDANKIPDRVVTNIKKSPHYQRLGKIESQITQAMKLTELLPTILKTGKTTNLGVLVQDQDELRPTGGLIKQLIVFTIDNGVITETRSFFPDNIDAIALGTAKSPEMLARISGSDDFKFKDMNYPADFSQAAEYITWFLIRTINLQIDTLIAVNKSLFEKMLDEDKAIEVTGKTITSQDMRSSSSDSDPSRPVVDYYLKAFDLGKLSLITLGRSILSEIEQGNIRLYSTDTVTQSSISRLPLSGIVSEAPCHSGLSSYDRCLNQVTYLNESNMFYAPVNHSLKRDVTHAITLGQSYFNHEYRLKYSFQNDFTLLNRPYQTIYQLFAPSGSEITKIEIDSQAPIQSGSFTKMKHGNLEYFQIPLTFPPLGDHTVLISFDTPLREPFDPSTTALSFTEIRQPGTQDKGILLTVKIAENTRPLAITHEIQTIQGSLAVQLPPQTTTFGLGLGY